MPLVVAPLVAFALGALLGFALGLPERGADLRFGRAVAAWFAVLGFAPVPAYFAWSVPSWSFAYFVNGDHVPSAVSLAAVALAAAFVVVGFEVAQRAIADERPRAALGAGFASAALAMLLVAMLARRLWLVGSYAEVTGGFAVPSLATTSTGIAVLGLDGLLGLALWTALSALRAPSSARAKPPPAMPLGIGTSAPAPKALSPRARRTSRDGRGGRR